MALPAAFTDLSRIAHHVALAPMSGCAGGGVQRRGVGLAGGGGDADWLKRKLVIAVEGTAKPCGAGFLSRATGAEAVERALAGARGQWAGLITDSNVGLSAMRSDRRLGAPISLLAE